MQSFPLLLDRLIAISLALSSFVIAQTAPTITDVTAKSTLEGTATAAITFTVGDAETPVANLVVSGTSSDTSLVPNSQIVFGGSSANRTVTITPAALLSGTTTITLTVTDADLMTATDSFVLTVNPLYSIPSETIPDLTMPAGRSNRASSLVLNYQLGDSTWVPSVSSSNPALFPTIGTASNTSIRLQGAGTNRTLRFQPRDGVYGESTISLTVTGAPSGPSVSTFKVTVTPRAFPDNLFATAGKTSTLDVLRNDTQAQSGSVITITSYSTPSNGQVAAGTVSGTLRYTPNPGFIGTDSFTYTTLYNTGKVETATAYMTVGPYYPIDGVHTDIRMNYINGVWTNEIHADLSFGNPVDGGSPNPTILDYDEALFMANPTSKINLPTSLDAATYSFVGVPLGSDIWSLPQSSKAGVLWPGISTESLNSGTFAAYTPVGDPRANGNFVWIRVELVGFRIPTNSNFSMFTIGSTPTVYFDSIDGVNGPNEITHGNNVSDTFWATSNGHYHMNWWFTHPGRYELDVRTKAFINQGGNLVEVTSPINTLHFMVYGTGDPSSSGALTEAPPLLNPDSATLVEDSNAFLIDVLANDRSDPDLLENLIITSKTNGSHGNVTIAPGGLSLSYTPAANFAGTDTFTYTVTDEHGGVANAAVSVTVTGENDPPSFNGYSVNTAYETPTAISLVNLLAQTSDPEGDAVNVTAAGPVSAQGGTATLQVGSILYTPPVGFSGADSFSVVFADVQGATVMGTVMVQVASPPNPGADGTITPQITILAGGDIAISFQGNPGSSYQIQRSTSLSTWANLATVVAAVNGAVTFTDEDPPQPSAFYRLTKL